MGGKKAEEYKGVAEFFTFLSDTDSRQANLHTGLGLPADHQGRLCREDQVPHGFYQKNPGADETVRLIAAQQQAADRELARVCASATCRADPRRLVRGDRGGAARAPRPPRQALDARSSAATKCCASSNAHAQSRRGCSPQANTRTSAARSRSRDRAGGSRAPDGSTSSPAVISTEPHSCRACATG